MTLPPNLQRDLAMVRANVAHSDPGVAALARIEAALEQRQSMENGYRIRAHAAEEQAARLEAAARDYLTITTYDQGPRTWNATLLDACERLSAALTPPQEGA